MVLQVLKSTEKKWSHQGALCVLLSIARAYPERVAFVAAEVRPDGGEGNRHQVG